MGGRLQPWSKMIIGGWEVEVAGMITPNDLAVLVSPFAISGCQVMYTQNYRSAFVSNEPLNVSHSPVFHLVDHTADPKEVISN